MSLAQPTLDDVWKLFQESSKEMREMREQARLAAEQARLAAEQAQVAFEKERQARLEMFEKEQQARLEMSRETEKKSSKSVKVSVAWVTNWAILSKKWCGLRQCAYFGSVALMCMRCIKMSAQTATVKALKSICWWLMTAM